MKNLTEQLLRLVADFKGSFQGAYNIREDGQCAGRQPSEHIKITSKEDGKPGLDIHIDPGTKGETVYIPACVTHSDVNDHPRKTASLVWISTSIRAPRVRPYISRLVSPIATSTTWCTTISLSVQMPMS